MRKAFACALCFAVSLCCARLEASPPRKLEGLRLGWKTSKAVRFARKRGWRVTSRKRNKCGVSLMFKNRKGAILSLGGYRGRVFRISKFSSMKNPPVYRLSRWKARIAKMSRRYGKPRMTDPVPFYGAYVSHYRWINRSRWYSEAIRMSMTRPVIIKMVTSNLKNRRQEKAATRCKKRRR